MESIHLFQFSKTKANLSEEIIFQFYITRIHEGSELHCLDWEVLGKIKIKIKKGKRRNKGKLSLQEGFKKV
ncbi:hypothetical protein Q3G72_027819 [Acer saccharum]|nr:hypothetical protein Q3G72_027819 [Acer saccharum]